MSTARVPSELGTPEGDAHEAVGAGLEALLGDRRAQDVAEQSEIEVVVPESNGFHADGADGIVGTEIEIGAGTTRALELVDELRAAARVVLPEQGAPRAGEG